jgi:glycosidase
VDLRRGHRQYYLHLFLPQQPDLNWANPEVEAAMHDVLRFWLDRGVDGFRADVVHLIGKDPAYPDDPERALPAGRASAPRPPAHPRAPARDPRAARRYPHTGR